MISEKGRRKCSNIPNASTWGKNYKINFTNTGMANPRCTRKCFNRFSTTNWRRTNSKTTVASVSAETPIMLCSFLVTILRSWDKIVRVHRFQRIRKIMNLTKNKKMKVKKSNWGGNDKTINGKLLIFETSLRSLVSFLILLKADLKKLKYSKLPRTMISCWKRTWILMRKRLGVYRVFLKMKTKIATAWGSSRISSGNWITRKNVTATKKSSSSTTTHSIWCPSNTWFKNLVLN